MFPPGVATNDYFSKIIMNNNEINGLSLNGNQDSWPQELKPSGSVASNEAPESVVFPWLDGQNGNLVKRLEYELDPIILAPYLTLSLDEVEYVKIKGCDLRATDFPLEEHRGGLFPKNNCNIKVMPGSTIVFKGEKLRLVPSQSEVFGLYPKGLNATKLDLNTLEGMALKQLLSDTWPVFRAKHAFDLIRDTEVGYYMPSPDTYCYLKFDTTYGESFFVRMSMFDYISYQSVGNRYCTVPVPHISMWNKIGIKCPVAYYTDEEIWYLLYDLISTDKNICADTRGQSERSQNWTWLQEEIYELVSEHYGTTDALLDYVDLFKYFSTKIMNNSSDSVEIQSDAINWLGSFLPGRSNQSDISLLSAYRNIGSIAGKIDKAIDAINDAPTDSAIIKIFSALSKITGFVTELTKWVTEFIENPFETIKKIFLDTHFQLEVHDLSATDTLWMTFGYVGIITFAYAMRDNTIVSTGLHFLANYHFVKNITSESSSHYKFAALLSLCTIAISRSPELLSERVEIQSEVNVPAVAASFVSILGVMCAGVKTSTSLQEIFVYASNVLKPTYNTLRGLPWLIKFYESTMELFNLVVTKLFGENSMWLLMARNLVKDDDMRDYIIYSLTQTPDTLIVKLALDEVAQKEWDRMHELHLKFIRMFASAKTRPPLSNTAYSLYTNAFKHFKELLAEYDKIKRSRDYFRPEPFIVYIFGEPGVGKTVIRNAFAMEMYKWYKKLDPTLPDLHQTGLVYVRNPGDKHWSGYETVPFAVAWDDVGSNRKADNTEFDEIMACASTNQLRLPMAELRDKGLLFGSKVLILCSNTQDANTNNLILRPDAFNRRRHVVLEMRRTKTEVTGVTSKCDFDTVELIARDNIDSNKIIKSFGPGQSEVVFAECYAWMRTIFETHVANQLDLVSKQKQQLFTVMKETLCLNEEEGIELEELVAKDLKLEFLQSVKEPDDPIVYESYAGNLVNQPTGLVRKVGKFIERGTKAVISEADEAAKTLMTFLRENMPSNYKALAYTLATIAGFGSVFSLYKVYNLVFGKAKLQAYDNNISYKSSHSIKPVVTQLQNYSMNVSYKTNKIKAIIQAEEDLDYETIMEAVNQDSIQAPIGETWESVTLNKVSPIEGNMFRVVKKYYDQLETEEDKILCFKLARRAIKTYKDVLPLDLPALSRKQMDVVLPASLVRSLPREQVFIQSDLPILMDHYQSALWMAFINGDKPGLARRIHAVQIKYSAFLFPKHFTDLITEEQDLCMAHSIRGLHTVRVGPKQIFPVGNLDWSVVVLPTLPHGRNILKHFATKRELEIIQTFNGVLLRYQSPTKPVITTTVLGNIRRFDTPISGTLSTGVVVVHPKGFSYDVYSVNGDCGSLLIATDNTVRSKIMGCHFGYTAALGRGHASLVPRETLEELVESVVSADSKFFIEKPCAIQCKASDVPSEFLSEAGWPKFEVLGMLPDAPCSPRRHKDLFRSPAYDQIYPATKDLSVLSCYDNRLLPEYRGPPDIMVRNYVGYSVPTREWPQDLLLMAKSYLREEFSKFKENTRREVKSLEWAINGEWVGEARVEHCEPLVLDTSAGYGFPGKKHLYFDTSDPKNIKISDPNLARDVDDLWESWKRGEPKPVIWTNALKSEPLKFSKIETGKTRTFMVAQTSFSIAVKRLFGAWTVAMKSTPVKSFSCLGVDVRSSVWTELYKELEKVGDVGVDQDFMNYDRIAVISQLANAVCDEINSWYHDGPVYARMRKIAIHEIIHSYVLCGNILTRKFQGNPSGNPLTTELNNSVNVLMLVMVYLIIALRKGRIEHFSLKSFKRNVSVKTYGDDVIYSLGPEVLDWFDLDLVQQIYAEHGITVTPANKTDRLEVMPLSSLTFLKCSFVPSGIPQYPWNAGLSKDSIYNMTQFYRLKPNSGTIEDAYTHNQLESCEYAYFWGQEFFDAHKDRINQWRLQHNLLPLTVTYDEEHLKYLCKLGILELGDVSSMTTALQKYFK
ncbi:MAG: nonstructural polyprotein [Dicistroviridae sp.]|nr:MAG: nonstructural polyprotein [Dicistroviridae sp.]